MSEKIISEKPLVLVDGSSYFYRAYHALPPLVNSQGQATGAIYGVINMLKKLINAYQPEYFAVIFDAKGKTFRDDLYPAYKANRAMMPEELRSQAEPLCALITAMGIAVMRVEGVEADDVIGTIAKNVIRENPDQKMIISTSDKDIAQLVNANVSLINTMNTGNTGNHKNPILLDEQGVYQKFGVKPAQIIDYLVLVGDTSDNVPGVPGVGPKTAAKWLNQYHTLENLVLNSHEITGKISSIFQQHREKFELIKSLVTIKCTVDLPLEFSDLKSLKPRKPDQEKLTDLLKNLEFKTWLSEILGQNLNKSAKNQENQEKNIKNIKNIKNYHCVTTESELEKLISKLNLADIFSIDTETTSLNIISARLVGISVGFNNGEAYYIPVGHDYLDAPVQLSLENVLEKFKSILENKNTQKIFHHLKYDLNIFKNYHVNIQGILYDTMLESYLFDSAGTRHDMDSLALKYLHRRTISFEEVAGKGAKQLTFNQVDINTASDYAAEDADITFQLHQYLWPKLESDPVSVKYFHEIEMPLATVLANMEHRGVLIQAELLKTQSKNLNKKILALETQAYQVAGQEFNLGSPKQLQEILYQKLQLPILEKTPSGQPSTAENVLQELALSYDFPKIILNHRTLSKLKSTYTDKLPEQIHPKTQRIHTSYHQAVTVTGRLSSSHPNLQNIPIKTEEGRQIRKAFIAPPGYKILSADYSQIELRLMAHLSQDQNLLSAFSENLDIHQATAAEIFNIKLSQVNHDQRRYAKTINFGLIYGMSAFGLAKQLGISREEAKQYIHLYFMRYPKIKDYMTNTIKIARDQGFVTTILGRKLYLPDINARNSLRQKAAERAAINAPLQGSAAELIKIAMINIDKFLKELPKELSRDYQALPAYMVMQVHDELVFEIAETQIEKIKNKIKFLMENVGIPLSVPMVASIGIGDNWDEAH